MSYIHPLPQQSPLNNRFPNPYQNYAQNPTYPQYNMIYANGAPYRAMYGAPYGAPYGGANGETYGAAYNHYASSNNLGLYSAQGNYNTQAVYSAQYNAPYGYSPCTGCQGQQNYNYGQYYGQNYTPVNSGCGCSGYSAMQTQSNYHQLYEYPSASTHKDCGCGCSGAGNCGDYGLSLNRQRLTPKYPSKLGHSYITSGGRVEDKLVINQANVESAPFQTQRRKTYQPYTRKYLQYEDYVQYVPVQRSEWQYHKVMKQIDFVPQEYYESNIQYVPREKIQQKIQYLPVEQKILHVPQQGMISINELKIQNQRIKDSKIMPIRATTSELIGLESSNFGVVNQQVISQSGLRNAFASNSGISIHPSKVSWIGQPNQEKEQLGDSNSINTLNRGSSFIRPAQSTVEMVLNSQIHPNQSHANRLIQNSQANQQRYMQSGISHGQVSMSQQQGDYRFPQRGGVVIGSSSGSQSYNPSSNSFGPKGTIAARPEQVGETVLEQLKQDNRTTGVTKPQVSNLSSNFRQSNQEQSQDYQFQGPYRKKNSLVHRIQEDDY